MQIMKRKNLIWGVTGCLMMIGFASCLKSSPVEPPKPICYISVVNMSYKAPPVELWIDGEKVTPPMTPGAFFARYSAVDPGIFDLLFKKATTDSLVASLPPSQIYDSSEFYTVLLYDKPAGGAAATRIIDDVTNLDITKAHFRFFQLASDIPSVDFYIENSKVSSARTPADNASDPNYNIFTAFEPNVYSIKAKVAGTDSVVTQTSFSDFVASGVYTIFLKGRVGGTGDNALGLSVLRAAN